MGKRDRKRGRADRDEAGQGMGPGAGYGQGMGQGVGSGFGPGDPMAGVYGTGPFDAGLLQGLPAFLRSRNAEQFLLGAAIGAAAAWILADEELRGRLIKAGVRLYASVAGGFEEMKEQMSDLKAEVEAERHQAG